VKRVVAVLILTGAAALMLAGTGSLVKRDVLKSLEADLTGSFRSHEMEIYGFPNGLYADGVGVVFTTEISLTYAPMINPFQQTFPPEYKERIRQKELKQVPVLREELKQFLLKSSVTMDTLPANELIVVGVKISHQIWEDKTGVPEQIVMQGQKSKLMDAKLGKAPADGAIKVQEQ
jgi:hypothetical protein